MDTDLNPIIDTDQRTLMIVEDEAEIALLIRDVLEVKGYRCLIESHGENVMDRALLDRPDLILLDIKLMGIDGYTVCRRLKSEPLTRDIPVVFVSALRTERDVIEAREAGGVYFVSKPFDIEFLAGKIEEILIEHQVSASSQEAVRVLCVQSEGIVAGSYRQSQSLPRMEASEFEVLSIDEPRDTLRRATAFQPKCIILDLDDSLISLKVIIDALKNHRISQRIPILILTSFPEKGRPDLRRLPGVRGVLPKPVSALELATAIRSAVHHRTDFNGAPVLPSMTA